MLLSFGSNLNIILPDIEKDGSNMNVSRRYWSVIFWIIDKCLLSHILISMPQTNAKWFTQINHEAFMIWKYSG